MTKSETHELTMTLKFGRTMGADYVARALSALHRAARSNKSKAEILAAAQAAGVVGNPEFIL